MGFFHFARRYFGNHNCFLFLRLLRCVSSPRLPLQPMYSAADVSTLPETGCPIQKSPDQSLFSSSPKLIAAYHVFHRLLTPRHPPIALNSLVTILRSMLNVFMYSYPNCQRTKQMNNRLFSPPENPANNRDSVDCTKVLVEGGSSVVEVNGLEPMTSCVQGRRSPN